MSKKKLALSLVAALFISGVGIAQAAPQKFTFKLEGECADSKTEGTIEEDVTNSCRIVVTFNPAKPFRTVNLQYKDENGMWQFADDDNGEKISRKSDSYKRVEIAVPAYDADGVFYDFPQREFRVYIAKSGTAAGAASKSFIINYQAAGGAGDAVDTVDEGATA